jgi:hypothetical protein
MLSKTPFRVAGAAMLGTVALLGTNAANAQIDFDDRSTAVTYAMETLTSTIDKEDNRSYYVVTAAGGGNADALNLTAEQGVGGKEDDKMVVTISLDGLRFASTSALMLDSASSAVNANQSAVSGGTTGTDVAVFTFDHDSQATTPESMINVSLQAIGVDVNGTGSMTLTVRNKTLAEDLEGIPNTEGAATHTITLAGAVKVASALKENADPMSPTATVEHKFLSFDGNPLATLGSLMISANEMYLDAADSGTVTLADLIDDGAPTNNDPPDANDPEEDGSSVIFTGDFSFASMVTLDDDATCDDAVPDGTGTPPEDTSDQADLLQRYTSGEDAGEVKDTEKLMAQSPAYVNDNPYLCIHVVDAEHEDAIAIPETLAYMVMTSYSAGTTDAAFPPRDGEHALGRIMRDGVTVRLPFLTTYSEYNQRLVIVNRGGEADYSISFTPEVGVMADPGSDAEGTLPAKATKVINLDDGNLVTLSGRTRTAGTLIIESQDSMIDVATTLVNKATGTTDTVVHK